MRLADKFIEMINEGRSEVYALGYLQADGDLFWHRPQMRNRGPDTHPDYVAGYDARLADDLEDIFQAAQPNYPPICILTGAPGENADDCTTHNHERGGG